MHLAVQFAGSDEQRFIMMGALIGVLVVGLLLLWGWQKVFAKDHRDEMRLRYRGPPRDYTNAKMPKLK